MTTSSDACSSTVRLNIGGKKFCTTVDTLTHREPHSMLAAMFSGRHTVCKESEKGYVFIDRDGKHFRHILNWLRDGVAPIPSLSDLERVELLREAEYYQLLGLVARVKEVVNEKDGEQKDADLTRTDIIKCVQYTSAIGGRVRLKGVNLSGVDLSKLDLSGGLGMSGVDFSRACLKNVNFSGANLHNARFEWVDAENTNFREATLTKCEFTGANLCGALLAKANLYTATLSRCRLCDADLRYARLENASLEGTNLEGANLEGANLEEANLTGAIFCNAKMKGANLQGASLDGADFRKTSLEGVLYGANIRKAIR